MKLFEKHSFTKIFLFIFIAFCFVFQLIYIDADTPISLANNAGAYCDEGYKTPVARNMVLFGKTHCTYMREYPSTPTPKEGLHITISSVI